MIYLVEEFFSIQGEGKYVGTPSIFFRFGGCNLTCAGFGSYRLNNQTYFGCDTFHAVNRKLFTHTWERADFQMLCAKLERYKLPYKPHIVITGGEPLLYYNNTTLYRFITHLVDEGYRVTIETNGTIDIDFDAYPSYKEVTFALSIKLANSGEPYAMRVKKEAIARTIEHAKEAFFKFVVDEPSDEIESITEGFSIPIYCMALASSQTELAQRSPKVVDFCLKKGYIYSDRVHIRIWNKETKR